MSQALFYPWIDIRDEAWLKTSVLYWDSVRTIVPESIAEPYSTETGHALQAADFLQPLRVHSGMEEIEELTGDALAYLDTAEGAELVLSEGESRRHHIHVEKLPSRLRQWVDMHPEKLPYEVFHMMERLASPSGRGSDWLRVDDGFANFYMTLLANRLSERVGAGLLTSLPAADRLAVAARLDAQLNGILPLGIPGPWRHWREYEAFGRRYRMPRHIAPGLLAHLAIERTAVAPDTPIDRLIKFKDSHRDELAQFRTKIIELAGAVETDMPMEALRERVEDLYRNEVAPAVANVRQALHGRRIRWMADGLLKVAFLSAGSSTMMVVAGLSVPAALLAGAGISLIASSTMYNVEKRESLRTNPYTYLLSLERELA